MRETSVRVSTSSYQKLMNCLDSSNPKKIAAIKLIRAECSLGLKEAKDAIERFQHENFGGNYPHAAAVGLKIVTGPAIKKIIVDYGEGDIAVDLEEMQMKALMDMTVIGLDAARDIISLVETLEAFSDGSKIGVIK